MTVIWLIMDRFIELKICNWYLWYIFRLFI